VGAEKREIREAEAVRALRKARGERARPSETIIADGASGCRSVAHGWREQRAGLGSNARRKHARKDAAPLARPRRRRGENEC
jgi:hypothetical protein